MHVVLIVVAVGAASGFITLVTVTIRRTSRAANFGTGPADLAGLRPMDALVTFSGRMFGPNSYVLYVSADSFGITVDDRLGRYFYPSWWFRPGEVQINRTQTHQLWNTNRARPGITCRFHHRGEDERLDIAPAEPERLIDALRNIGFEIQ